MVEANVKTNFYIVDIYYTTITQSFLYVAAQADRLAVYVNFYQTFATITYSIQNHKAVPLFLVHQITEEGIKL